MIVSILTDVFAVSLIGGGLAALLVVAERFIANYGECKVTINGEKEMIVEGGGSLLSTLGEQKLFIPSACGGRGTCGLCKVKVLDGAGPLLPTEEPYLDDEERANHVRLSCQVKVRGDLQIEIPEELFNIKEYEAECEEITDLTYDMKQFRFRLRQPAEIKYTPGQYVQLLTPKYEKSSEEVYRAYSISSDPADKTCIELVIRLVPGGICTTYCFEYLKVGDPVRFNGPYGEFRLTDTDAEMIMIAGGSGVAPIKCMLHEMANTNCERKATFFFGGNTLKDMCLEETMAEFEKRVPNFTFVPVLARPEEGEKWDGETGLVTEAVRRMGKDLSDCEGYLCGSPGMIDASVKVLTELGMAEDRVYYDKFA